RAGEVLHHAGRGGTDYVADGLRVAEARDANHQVGVPHAANLAESGLVERRLRRCGRVGRQDRPPGAVVVTVLARVLKRSTRPGPIRPVPTGRTGLGLVPLLILGRGGEEAGGAGLRL